MQPTLTPVRTRAVTVRDAPLVHALYSSTPEYFDIISIPVPTTQEVATDIATAISDPRRHVELLMTEAATPSTGNPAPTTYLADEVSGLEVVGYLDYKLDYPQEGDATVNLLLIKKDAQSSGYGSACVKDLEARLKGKARRLLASIYGENPRAKKFWGQLGYHFAIDAKPLLEWYAKDLT